MNDEHKTKAQLVQELAALREQAAGLEAAETVQKRTGERLARVNACFLSFSADPSANINRLTALLGELLGATCALYNRLDQGMLCSTGQWNTPPDYNPIDRPEGHICYDVIRRGEDKPFIVRDLAHTPYAQTDPNVSAYQLQAYVGQVVRCGEDYVGSLCAVFQRDFVPTGEDLALLGIFAAAVGVEEERKRALDELAAYREHLEARVEERTAQFLRVNKRLEQEIAERSQVEQALRESKERYHRISEMISDYAYAFRVEADGALTLEWIAGSFERITGFSPAESQARGGWTTLIHPEDMPIAQTRARRLLVGEHDVSEFRIVRKDGGVRWLRDHGHSIWDEAQGRVVYIYGAAEDITERKRAEEALRKSEERLRLALESTNDGLWDWNLKTGEIFFSPRYYTMLGYEPYEMPQALETWMSLIHPDDREGVARTIFESIKARHVAFDIEFRMQAKSGEWRRILDRGRVIEWNEADIPTRMLGVHLDITERAAAIDELRQRNRELTALYETALEISAQLDLTTLLQAIVQRATALLGARMGSLYLMRPDEQTLELVVNYNQPSEFIGTRLHLGEGVSGRVAQTGQPLMVEDYSSWEGRAAVYEGRTFRRLLGVPLKSGPHVIGVINITDDVQTGLFFDDQIRLVSLFADQAAIAVRNARLYEQAQQEIAARQQVQDSLERRNRQLALLNEASRALGSTLDLDQLLATVLEQVRHLLDVTACSVWLRAPATGELVCQHVIGPHSQVVRGWRLRPGQGFVGWVARTGESLVVSDAEVDERHFTGVDQQTGLPLHSFLSLPLRVQDDVIGVLQVVDTAKDRFTSHDLALLEPLAAGAAIAIENARLYAQARRDAATLEVLLREVNHRVKNNLTGIAGMLYTARDRARVEDHATFRATVDDLIGRVRGLSTVHDMLSAAQWAPLRLDDLILQVTRAALRGLPHGQRVVVQVSPAPVRVTPDEAHDLTLVFNELATNAGKYALGDRDAARISVHISHDDGVVRCEFRDDGPGYPDDVIRLERSSVGFDLIRTIVSHSLDGELALCNDGGAVAVLRFTPALLKEDKQ